MHVCEPQDVSASIIFPTSISPSLPCKRKPPFTHDSTELPSGKSYNSLSGNREQEHTGTGSLASPERGIARDDRGRGRETGRRSPGEAGRRVACHDYTGATGLANAVRSRPRGGEGGEEESCCCCEDEMMSTHGFCAKLLLRGHG